MRTIFFILFCFPFLIWAQPIERRDVKVPLAIVILSNGATIYGHVMSVDSLAIYLNQNYDQNKYFEPLAVSFSEIEKVTYRRKGYFFRGVLIGIPTTLVLFFMLKQSGYSPLIYASPVFYFFPASTVLGMAGGLNFMHIQTELKGTSEANEEVLERLATRPVDQLILTRRGSRFYAYITQTKGYK